MRSDEHGHAGPRVFASWYSIIGPPTSEMASCVHLCTKHLASTRSHNTVAVKHSLPPTESLIGEAREHEEKGEAVSSPPECFPPTKYFSCVSIFFFSSILFLFFLSLPPSSPGQTFSTSPHGLSGPVCLPSPVETLKIETSFEEKTV